MLIAFLIATVGGLLMIFFKAEASLISISVLFAKFGISLAFNMVYIAMP